MSLLAAIIVGVLVGGGVGVLILENIDFFLLNVLMGIVGSIIGLVLFAAFGLNASSNSLFSLRGALICATSAAVLVLAFNGLHKIMPKRVAKQSSVHEDPPIEED